MSNQEYVQQPSNEYLEMCIEGYKENNVPIDQIANALEEIDDKERRCYAVN